MTVPAPDATPSTPRLPHTGLAPAARSVGVSSGGTAATPSALPYHRLAHLRPRRRWWAPLLTGVAGAAMFIALFLAVLVPLVIAALFLPSLEQAIAYATNSEASFDLDHPVHLLTLLIPLALMTPVLLLASRMVQGRHIGLLSSVAGRLRWGWLGRTLGLAFAIYGAGFALLLGLGPVLGEPLTFDASHPGIPMTLVLVVLFVPLQAAAEEYVFRGYLMQLVGAWLRHPVFAILLPVPLFVLGHGYDIWGSLTIASFAVVAGWLSWRTGGLEAAIAMHVANNVLLFLLASFSLVDGNATGTTPIGWVSDLAIMAVYALAVLLLAGRCRIARTAHPAADETVPAEAAPTPSAPHAYATSVSASRIV